MKKLLLVSMFIIITSGIASAQIALTNDKCYFAMKYELLETVQDCIDDKSQDCLDMLALRGIAFKIESGVKVHIKETAEKGKYSKVRLHGGTGYLWVFSNTLNKVKK
jgi:hypothetical protein